jgi:hypothetical protein
MAVIEAVQNEKVPFARGEWWFYSFRDVSSSSHRH